MCGLIGYIGKKDYDPLKIKILMLYNQERGNDASGFFNGHGIAKDSICATKLLVTYDIGKSNIFVGHTRQKSVGFNSKENAHPFVVNQTITVHNGTLKNYITLANNMGMKYADYDVDSQVLAKLMEKEGPLSAIKKIEGTAAILHYDINENLLYAFHNIDRPLFRAKIDDGIYFSSMENSLYAIGAKKAEIHELKVDCLYTIDHNLEIKTKPVRMKVPEVVTYVSTSYNQDKPDFRVNEYVKAKFAYDGLVFGRCYRVEEINNGTITIYHPASSERRTAKAFDLEPLGPVKQGHYAICEFDLTVEDEIVADKGDVVFINGPEVYNKGYARDCVTKYCKDVQILVKHLRPLIQSEVGSFSYLQGAKDLMLKLNEETNTKEETDFDLASLSSEWALLEARKASAEFSSSIGIECDDIRTALNSLKNVCKCNMIGNENNDETIKIDIARAAINKVKLRAEEIDIEKQYTSAYTSDIMVYLSAADIFTELSKAKEAIENLVEFMGAKYPDNMTIYHNINEIVEDFIELLGGIK